MLKDSMVTALNDQIQKEFASSYLYLAMAAQFDDENLPGFAAWMKAQAAEEHGHGMKIYGYLGDHGARVVLQTLEAPPKDFGTPKEVFEKVLAHEQKVTGSINQLYELALKEKDYATQAFLQWFITEQVEEEKTAGDILAQLEAVEAHKHALIILDRHMASRGG